MKKTVSKKKIVSIKWQWLLVFVVSVFLILLARSAWIEGFSHENTLLNAAIGGLIAALATTVGTLPILFSTRFSPKMLDTFVGFGAGVMLAATFFSLTLPGISIAQSQGYGNWLSPMVVGIGILLGAALLLSMEKWVPHEHFIKGQNEAHHLALKRTWLFVFAISLHNLPEGLAIGVAFAGLDPVAASTVAAGIAIQDIPEGFVISAALLQAGYHKKTSIFIGILSGLIEPVGAILGVLIVGLSNTLLPWAMGFSAGAMLFVISHEIIPESHRKGHETMATAGLMIGFVLMMTLDHALGAGPGG